MPNESSVGSVSSHTVDVGTRLVDFGSVKCSDFCVKWK